MIFRNSVKNIIRSGKKTALFIILITILTSTLCLGLSIWISADQFLLECNANYMTIGLLEYMGPEYPDESVFDEGMSNAISDFDFSLISGNENVLLWERSARALGYIEGLVRTDVYAPLRESGVVIVSNIGNFNNYSPKIAVIEKSLFSTRNPDGKMVLIEPDGFELKPGRSYVLNGSFTTGKTSYMYFVVTPFVNKAASNGGFIGEDSIKADDITGKIPFSLSDESNIFNKIARTYSVINNSVSVHSTRNLNSLPDFHQQRLFIEKGRDFTTEEYESGAKVCIVSELVAASLGKGIGDSIELSIAISEDTPFFESYWVDSGFTHSGTYEITGICNSTGKMSYDVFIPANSDVDFTVNQIGYTLGQAVIANDRAGLFYDEINPLLPDRMRLTIYDQGYASVAEPFEKVRRIAFIITLACVIVSLAVLALFGFLFVYRQRDTADIMIKLGTGKRRVYRYFLYGSGLISLFAAALGSAAGFYLSGFATGLVNSTALNYSVSDTRYSIGSLSIQKPLEWIPDIEYGVFGLTALCLLLVSLISCLSFATVILARKNKKPRGKKRKPPLPSVKGLALSGISGGPFKYSLVSIFRGGQRSIITICVALSSVIFLNQLAHTSGGYNARLLEIYEDSVITGQFMDSGGIYHNKLSLEAFQLNDLYNSGYVDSLHLSREVPYYYLGRPDPKGEDENPLTFVLPKEFALETFLDKLTAGPKIIYTNSISASPEFIYSTGLSVEYLQGFDESFLAQKPDGIPNCLVSTDFMEETGSRPGDVIRVLIWTYKGIEHDMKIVGSYVKEGKKDNIYCQLGVYVDLDLLYSSDPGANEDLYSYYFDSANFVISDASKIDDFKTYLYDYGYSEVNNFRSIRQFIVLDDKSFNSMKNGIYQKIRHTKVLHPFLYTLTGIIAFVLSYLLIASRKKELALMRGLGAGKFTIFLSFFIEQALLCLIGCALGIAGWTLFAGRLDELQQLLALGYIACYFLGTATAIVIMNHTVVLSILNEED